MVTLRGARTPVNAPASTTRTLSASASAPPGEGDAPVLTYDHCGTPLPVKMRTCTDEDGCCVMVSVQLIAWWRAAALSGRLQLLRLALGTPAMSRRLMGKCSAGLRAN
jgi:hypothetical protein